uniref:alpha/beta fold hydrolase n=1 Tax=Paractinoplanes polyasparticus TaxID=2856853 RepID=UPI001C85F133|nr:alpha/beta hydrolase [Actinoplanes polyasparticus]
MLRYSKASGFQSGNLLPEPGRIIAPTLVVVGHDDFTCDRVSQAERIHAALPSPALELIAKCGHFPWIEQPAAFDAVCETWFAGP